MVGREWPNSDVCGALLVFGWAKSLPGLNLGLRVWLASGEYRRRIDVKGHNATSIGGAHAQVLVGTKDIGRNHCDLSHVQFDRVLKYIT